MKTTVKWLGEQSYLEKIRSSGCSPAKHYSYGLCFFHL